MEDIRFVRQLGRPCELDGQPVRRQPRLSSEFRRHSRLRGRQFCVGRVSPGADHRHAQPFRRKCGCGICSRRRLDQCDKADRQHAQSQRRTRLHHARWRRHLRGKRRDARRESRADPRKRRKPLHGRFLQRELQRSHCRRRVMALLQPDVLRQRHNHDRRLRGLDAQPRIHRAHADRRPCRLQGRAPCLAPQQQWRLLLLQHRQRKCPAGFHRSCRRFPRGADTGPVKPKYCDGEQRQQRGGFSTHHQRP